MEQLIKALEDLVNKTKEVVDLQEEIKRDLQKIVGQDELWGSDRDNQNEDSNFEQEQ